MSHSASDCIKIYDVTFDEWKVSIVNNSPSTLLLLHFTTLPHFHRLPTERMVARQTSFLMCNMRNFHFTKNHHCRRSSARENLQSRITFCAIWILCTVCYPYFGLIEALGCNMEDSSGSIILIKPINLERQRHRERRKKRRQIAEKHEI
jgi:hypothetical protein